MRIAAGFWSDEASDPESLGLWRMSVCAGLILCLFYYFSPFLFLDLGGPQFRLMDAAWHLEWIGVDRLDPVLLQSVFWITLIALLASLFGYQPRFFLVIALFGFLYLKGCRDGIAMANKGRMAPFYFALLILVLSRCSDVFSIRAGGSGAEKGRAKPALEARDVLWPIRLFQIVLVIFYAGAGINKLRLHGLDWPLHPPIQRGVLSNFKGLELDSFSWLKESIGTYDALNPVLGLVGVVLELAFVLVLLRNFWVTSVLCGSLLVFHVLNSFLLYAPFAFHPVLCLAFYDLAKLRRGELKLI